MGVSSRIFQKQVDWICLLRNPIDLLLNKSFWKRPCPRGCCVHVWGKTKVPGGWKKKQPIADSLPMRFCSTNWNWVSPTNGREISSSLFGLTRFGQLYSLYILYFCITFSVANFKHLHRYVTLCVSRASHMSGSTCHVSHVTCVTYVMCQVSW